MTNCFSTPRIVRLNSKVASIKGTLLLDEYIKKFKAICDKLATIGKSLLDIDKSVSSLKGTWKQI